MKLRYVLCWDPVRKSLENLSRMILESGLGQPFAACFDNCKSCLSTAFLELLKLFLMQLFSFVFLRNMMSSFSPQEQGCSWRSLLAGI